MKTVETSTIQTCSASTTASNSAIAEFCHVFDGEVICDWLSFRHDFAVEKRTKAIESGKTLKIRMDGLVEWEKDDFTQIKCPTSDTSVRIKCDGHRFYFSGNIGRFAEKENINGHSTSVCFRKAIDLINRLYPSLDTTEFGLIKRQGTIAEYGTYLTRLDLASNYETDKYAQISSILSQRKIGQRMPTVGKYGPTWGYDTKRGQYWKAKLYDKTAEQEGKRTPNTNKTLARFEIQLGSEYLRQKSLNYLSAWGDTMNTENIVYGRFSSQILHNQLKAEDWTLLPVGLRQHAIMWRDGVDPRTYLKKTQYYKATKQLRQHGIDISRPCNVMNLVQQVQVLTMRSVPCLRRAA